MAKPPTKSQPKPPPVKPKSRVVRMFWSRPRLTIGLCAGLVAGGACTLLAPQLKATTDFIIGWDVLCLTFLAFTGLSMLDHTPEQIRASSAKDDEGRRLILTLVLVAAAVSVGAIANDLGLAKAEHGLVKAAHVALAFVTVALSWTIMQVIFGLHYAHEFYDWDKSDGEGDAGGLAFPGTPEPDYRDFLHFSIVIGVAAQTADVAFTSQTLRRVGTLHSVVAFVFNTLIVALTINLVAALF